MRDGFHEGFLSNPGYHLTAAVLSAKLLAEAEAEAELDMALFREMIRLRYRFGGNCADSRFWTHFPR